MPDALDILPQERIWVGLLSHTNNRDGFGHAVDCPMLLSRRKNVPHRLPQLCAQPLNTPLDSEPSAFGQPPKPQQCC
jgi:hypothetical protein